MKRLLAAVLVLLSVSSFAELEFTIGTGNGVALHPGSAKTDWKSQEFGLMWGEDEWYLDHAIVTGDRAPCRRTCLPDTHRTSFGRYKNFREGHAVRPYMGIGLSYFGKSPEGLLPDNWAFDITVGVALNDRLRLWARHQSTRGRTEPNTGIDMAGLTLTFPLH